MLCLLWACTTIWNLLTAYDSLHIIIHWKFFVQRFMQIFVNFLSFFHTACNRTICLDNPLFRRNVRALDFILRYRKEFYENIWRHFAELCHNLIRVLENDLVTSKTSTNSHKSTNATPVRRDMMQNKLTNVRNVCYACSYTRMCAHTRIRARVHARTFIYMRV